MVTRTRLESCRETWWLDSTRVTFFTTWLESSHSQWLKTESFLQYVWVPGEQTQFVCTQRNENFILQWWSRLAQIFCFARLVVLCCILRISVPNLRGGRPETLLSLTGQ